MEENPVAHPGVPEEQYQRLGKKTFWILFLQRAQAVITLFFLTIILFALDGQSFWRSSTQLTQFTPYVNDAAWGCTALFIVVLGITWFISWIMYSNFKFALGDNSLKIKRGVLTKEEVSIPYRQIQDVDIRRDLSFQMMGMSRIVILTAGHEDSSANDDESEGILPALDKNLAEWLQAQLLQRANVQKVVMSAPAPPNQ